MGWIRIGMASVSFPVKIPRPSEPELPSVGSVEQLPYARTALGPGQLGGLGAGLAGLSRRRIRNPGSLLSFS